MTFVLMTSADRRALGRQARWRTVLTRHGTGTMICSRSMRAARSLASVGSGASHAAEARARR